jgi:IS30 family transposase
MSRHHLTISEREIISQLVAQGYSSRKIAEQLGRTTSTIARELRRNTRASGIYSPSTAQHKYQQRRQGAKRPWKLLQAALKALPIEIRKTITVDNGKEFARHQELEAATNMQVYFAEPYSSWQRGLNENTNVLLRQYFPKGSDFRKLTPAEIERAMKELNHRPRKRLNYQTPHEILMQHIVALQN